MSLLERKLNELKKVKAIKFKTDFFKTIFQNGFNRIIFLEELKDTNINEVISLIDNSRLDFEYKIRPSLILNLDEEAQIETNLFEEISAFFTEENLLLLFNYIYNFDFEISGYASINREALANNVYKMGLENGFIINESNSQFLYYKSSLKGNKLYVYKGIIEDKFVKIIW